MFAIVPRRPIFSAPQNSPTLFGHIFIHLPWQPYSGSYFAALLGRRRTETSLYEELRWRMNVTWWKCCLYIACRQTLVGKTDISNWVYRYIWHFFTLQRPLIPAFFFPFRTLLISYKFHVVTILPLLCLHWFHTGIRWRRLSPQNKFTVELLHKKSTFIWIFSTTVAKNHVLSEWS